MLKFLLRVTHGPWMDFYARQHVVLSAY